MMSIVKTKDQVCMRRTHVHNYYHAKGDASEGQRKGRLSTHSWGLSKGFGLQPGSESGRQTAQATSQGLF